jgi:hypothetical protein
VVWLRKLVRPGVCRYNINTVQKGDIFKLKGGIIPNMGEVRWVKLDDYRRRLFKSREQITDPYQLMSSNDGLPTHGGLDGVGRTIVEDWMPFFAFVPVDPPPWSRA